RESRDSTLESAAVISAETSSLSLRSERWEYTVPNDPWSSRYPPRTSLSSPPRENPGIERRMARSSERTGIGSILPPLRRCGTAYAGTWLRKARTENEKLKEDFCLPDLLQWGKVDGTWCSEVVRCPDRIESVGGRMRLRLGFVPACLVVFACARGLVAEEPFDIPLRITMGGSTTVDSYGRTWLAEGPGAGDLLNIRPDDAGGANWAENWTLGNMNADSFLALGFDPGHPGDQYIFNTIRWDDGGNPPDFLMEIPVPNGSYLVNLYFNEACCPARHFKITLQDEVVNDDVSYEDYDPAAPALGKLGRLSFPGIVVTDRILKIGLLPCLTCPGATDGNAILDALEILSGEGCDHSGLDFNCAFDAGTGEVKGSWKSLAGAASYQVL